MTLSTNTPGWFGYLAAILASSVAGALFALIPGVIATDPAAIPAIVLIYVPIISIAGAFLGMPLGIAGAAVVHVVCRRIADQRIHIVVAGLAGLVGGTAYWALVFGPSGHWYLGSDLNASWIGISIGLGAAVGRAAVIPLVRSRRRLALQGCLTGTAR